MCGDARTQRVRSRSSATRSKFGISRASFFNVFPPWVAVCRGFCNTAPIPYLSPCDELFPGRPRPLWSHSADYRCQRPSCNNVPDPRNQFLRFSNNRIAFIDTPACINKNGPIWTITFGSQAPTSEKYVPVFCVNE